jgi:hypothetical protein
MEFYWRQMMTAGWKVWRNRRQVMLRSNLNHEIHSYGSVEEEVTMQQPRSANFEKKNHQGCDEERRLRRRRCGKANLNFDQVQNTKNLNLIGIKNISLAKLKS